MKSSKTRLMQLVKTAFSLAEASQKTSNDQAFESFSRRQFLRNVGIGTAGFGTLAACAKPDLVPSSQLGKFENATNAGPKIGIIGAGIAGLHAAHTLVQHNVSNFKIYEASARVGGRMFTAQNIMAEGLSTELGGEFIDSGHKDMLKLAAEFNLELIDTEVPSETVLVKDAYFFNGRHYSLQEIVDEFCGITRRLRQDINSLPAVIDYTVTDPVVVRLDQMSISEYLDSIGATGVIKELLEVAYETEYGLSPQTQSSINLLFLISPNSKACTSWSVFGASDERYKIKGGNQQITDRLAHLYQNRIETNKSLTSISKTPAGRYKLTFDSGTETVDILLVSIPFTILRQLNVQLNFSTVKQQSINTLGYGTNAKLMLGFNNRIWRNQGYTGSAFTDNGLQLIWDNSQLQNGNKGGITVYSGGQTGVAVGNGTAQSQAAAVLPKLNQIYPGIASKFNGNAHRFHWPSHPYTLGSYACYKPGQWTTIAGAEIEEADGVYFAGEHCSFDFQGYMNGGAQTGRQAAKKIVKLLQP